MPCTVAECRGRGKRQRTAHPRKDCIYPPCKENTLHKERRALRRLYHLKVCQKFLLFVCLVRNTWLKVRYAFSALQHNSSTFVTQNAVTLYYQRANSARFPEVDVGSFSLLVQFPIYARKHVFVYGGINSPTDTSCLDVNQTFSYLWCVDWGFDLFQLVVRCHLN